jgi:hypothetical protein
LAPEAIWRLAGAAETQRGGRHLAGSRKGHAALGAAVMAGATRRDHEAFRLAVRAANVGHFLDSLQPGRGRPRRGCHGVCRRSPGSRAAVDQGCPSRPGTNAHFAIWPPLGSPEDALNTTPSIRRFSVPLADNRRTRNPTKGLG